jgi:alpha-beta hydrolase superfamily lysophospholipase
MMRRRLLVGLSAILSGCAPLVQKALNPTGGFSGPALDDDHIVAHDGARLALMTWLPDDEPSAVIVGLHGMDDYANAFHTAGPFWASQGVATYAYDQRGFGRSPGRGVWAGEALMTEDLRTACQLVRLRHPKALIAVAGESMGGAVAIAAFASDRPPAADRLILLSPAVWGFSQQPLPYSASLWVASHTFPGYVVEPPRFIAKKIWASDNIRELIAMGKDPQLIWGSRFDPCGAWSR